jgi:hypothetical protein
MTVEEARMLWLLRLGSGWVGEAAEFTEDTQLWEAYLRLTANSSFETNPNSHAMKLKCKS